ncbi:hypothetical protein FHG87_017062 [Trinorchestia longiramus]|nr:hypothetical protein FHG87_017062 [Trinorchestia longiramus]
MHSLQLFNIRDCCMEEFRFCYSIHESSAITENQSHKNQKVSCQLELSRQLELNGKIELLAGRLKTIKIQQKQNYKHELRLQSSETHLGQNLRTDNHSQHIVSSFKLSTEQQKRIERRDGK